MKKLFVVVFMLVMLSTVSFGATFTDTKDLSCEYAVDRIAHLGIVNGVSENSYAPEKSVTRAELSKMIVSVLKTKKGNDNVSFSDINNHWGRDFILNATSVGILNGYNDDTFKPDKEVSYAEAITIMIRALGYDTVNSNTGMWYDNYILKMKEIGLNDGVGVFNANSPANRGDIAILLWNMIKDSSNGKSYLDKSFSEFEYWDNVKITDITTYEGRIVYSTKKGAFYVDNDIDFSDLGGLVSGFYNSKDKLMECFKIDEGRSLKKVSGHAKTLNEMGYHIFECIDISGYGEKEYAEYINLFVNENTDEIVRVVFYDTRESYFAEEVKIGATKASIESKDTYDYSIVYLDNGQKIEYKFLRTESVKEIDLKSTLVYDGKIMEWDKIPNNSIIREIKKNKIYTYFNQYIDGIMNEKKTGLKNIVIDDISYKVADDCIVENIKTSKSMKMKDGLVLQDIQTIAQKDKLNRIYLNEFKEVVKLQFEYDIWGVHEIEAREEELKSLEDILTNIGIVTEIYNYVEDGNIISSVRVKSTNKKSFEVDISDEAYESKKFKFGDFVYYATIKEEKNGKTEEKKILQSISDKTEINGLQLVLDYNFQIENYNINKYFFDEQSEIIKVSLEHSNRKIGEYSKCTLQSVNLEELENYSAFKTMHLLVNKDGKVIRLYAFKEIGNTINFGIVRDIKDVEEVDKDKKIKTVVTKISLLNEDKNKKKYAIENISGISSGDLFTYDLSINKKNTLLIVKEVYKHQYIGNSHDLIIKEYKSKKIGFENIDLVIDMSKEYFEYKGKKYYFEDYIFVNAEVEKDKSTGEWKFTSFMEKEKDNVSIRKNSRFVIDELTGVIVVYSGYKE